MKGCGIARFTEGAAAEGKRAAKELVELLVAD
jgi:hypothetical protein